MTAIVILLVSFMIAVIGFAQSNRAKEGQTALFGLTKVGIALVFLAIVGFGLGIAKETQDSRSAQQREKLLEGLSNDVRDLAKKIPDERTANVFSAIGERIEAIATQAPESVLSESDFRASLFDSSNFDSSVFVNSNFEKSNFSFANFALSMFREANFSDARFDSAHFRGAIFPSADFRGADLSRIVVDEHTKLPTTQRQGSNNQIQPTQ